MNRNHLEIQSAIVKLEKNYFTCAPFNCFGNDNRKQISAMLDVIKNNRSKIWIYSSYLTLTQMLHKQPDNALWQAAIDAKDWLDGEFEIEELIFKEVEVSFGELFNRDYFKR